VEVENPAPLKFTVAEVKNWNGWSVFISICATDADVLVATGESGEGLASPLMIWMSVKAFASGTKAVNGIPALHSTVLRMTVEVRAFLKIFFACPIGSLAFGQGILISRPYKKPLAFLFRYLDLYLKRLLFA
jgi:hypothetical protein